VPRGWILREQREEGFPELWIKVRDRSYQMRCIELGDCLKHRSKVLAGKGVSASDVFQEKCTNDKVVRLSRQIASQMFRRHIQGCPWRITELGREGLNLTDVTSYMAPCMLFISMALLT
jgi:hypothetical protein